MTPDQQREIGRRPDRIFFEANGHRIVEWCGRYLWFVRVSERDGSYTPLNYLGKSR